ncbi:MAG TPA: DUF2062 domain-containing protein [Desulfobacteraceae bacterium]|nr:DUF2062 domain-containing protein [Desulfobacteraceae bacterium]
MRVLYTLQRTIKYYILKFVRLRGNPQGLAMGVAIGVFIGISPTMPLHTIAIIGFTLLMRVSTVAALISATIVSNPLTLVPLYYLCWLTGNFVLPGRLTWGRIEEVLHVLANQGFMDSLRAVSHLGIDAIAVMLTGGFLLGLPAALLSYFFSYYFFMAIRRKRQQKHLLN